jgi:hypothetical protein
MAEKKGILPPLPFDLLNPFGNISDIEEAWNKISDIEESLNQFGDFLNRLGRMKLPSDVERIIKEKEEKGVEKQPKNYISLVKEAESKLKEAKEITKCSKCQIDIDEILNSFSKKKKDLLDNELRFKIMEERGVKSWMDLDEETKREINEEVERRKSV